jgi:phenylpyruvate tautomerase PptA (4-oxalocrotonate tautomerase family)
MGMGMVFADLLVQRPRQRQGAGPVAQIKIYGVKEHLNPIKVSMFEGRSVETRTDLVRSQFERAQRKLGLAAADLEVTITERPKRNWGFRGRPNGRDQARLQSRGLRAQRSACEKRIRRS